MDNWSIEFTLNDFWSVQVKKIWSIRYGEYCMRREILEKGVFFFFLIKTLILKHDLIGSLFDQSSGQTTFHHIFCAFIARNNHKFECHRFEQTNDIHLKFILNIDWNRLNRTITGFLIINIHHLKSAYNICTHTHNRTKRALHFFFSQFSAQSAVNQWN